MGLSRRHQDLLEARGLDLELLERLGAKLLGVRSGSRSLARLMSNVEITGTCWLWRGTLSPEGYGKFGKNWMAHRLLYELLTAPISPGLTLDHLCRVKCCVNPDHLEPVTIGENKRRAIALKSHCAKGHPWVPGNIIVEKRGSRRCQTCHREEALARYHRERGNAQPTAR